MYIYAGHMGSLYATDYELSFDEVYCETVEIMIHL